MPVGACFSTDVVRAAAAHSTPRAHHRGCSRSEAALPGERESSRTVSPLGGGPATWSGRLRGGGPTLSRGLRAERVSSRTVAPLRGGHASRSVLLHRRG